MTISKSSEPLSKTQTEPSTSTSIEEKIQATLHAIQKIFQSKLGPRYLPNTLCNQLFSLQNKGFSLEVIARAMVVSNISIKTLLKENRTLSQEELSLIHSSCMDLSEASGSGSSSQVERETTMTEKRKAEERVQSSLPIKKRRLLYESYLGQLEKETQQPSEISTPSLELSKDEESIQSQALNFLLTTISNLEDIESIASHKVLCPREKLERQETEHLCSICSLAKDVVSNNKTTLTLQLKQLINSSNQQTVLKALLKLLQEEKISGVQNISHFSHLESSQLIVECGVEEAFFTPDKKTNLRLLNLHQEAHKVASLGISHPLTALIIQLWHSTTLPEEVDTTVTAVSKNQELSTLTIPMLVPTFTSIAQHRPKNYRLITSSHATFLAQLTLTTLLAIKNSPQGAPYISSIQPNKQTFPWKTINHVLGLILSSNSQWALLAPTNRLCFGPREKIRFPEKDCALISERQLTFAKRNCVLSPRTTPEIPEEIQLPAESVLLNISPTQPQQAPSAAKDPASSSSNPLLKPLMFLIEAISLNKHRIQTPILRCPNSIANNPLHSCSLCFLTKQCFRTEKMEMRLQLKTLLDHTNKETLANALLILPLDRNIHKILSQSALTLLDLAYLISFCNIGEAMTLPGKQNPASLTGLYYSIEKIILAGPQDPITTVIQTVWEHTPAYQQSLKEKEALSVTTLSPEGQIKLLQLPEISACFSSVELVFLKKSRGKLSSRNKGFMPASTLKFYSVAALITLHAFRENSAAAPYLKASPQGPAVPWEIVQHVCSLILAINPRWKVSIVPSKASHSDTQKLGFPEEIASPLFEKLQDFAARNYLSFLKTK
ncbi:hypothetical protein [Chlamydiifrater phoenicopteri]|uniref:hypothetical protein n=1 Tax=Chlamydiifrater phoenicopteri TaxID=2681469 RepID=UPI001BCCE6D9|nr:hypothetical protein [Chlamydiifrater phoenicopteri]